jgi:lipopolysaccharide export system permease protein
LPSLVSTILPIGFLIGLLFVFSKLYTDSELIVMRALGLSHGQILWPILSVAMILLTFLYALNLYMQPLATSSFKDMREDIRQTLTGKWLQPGTFTAVEGVMFYAKYKTRKGDMQGVFVYDARDPKNISTLTAEVGQILETPKGLRFALYRGTRQSLQEKTGKPSILQFDEYAVDVENPQSTEIRHKKANELSLKELFRPQADLSDRDRQVLRIEMHERLLLPLMVFPFTLMACLAFLLGDYNRRGRSSRILGATISCLVLETCVFSSINMSDKYAFLIQGAYGFIVVVVASAFYGILRVPKALEAESEKCA